MTALTRRSRFLRPLGALVLVALTALAAACGGGGDDNEGQDVEALLDRAFRQSIKSADVKIDGRLQVDGLSGFERPLFIKASGPYIGNDGALPKVDVDLNLSTSEGGQTIQSGFVSTGDRAFIKFGGQYYEQPRASVARTNRALARGRERRGGTLSELGLNPRNWVEDAKQEGDEEVAGVQTEHVSGTLNVRNVFADLNKLVQRSAGALPGGSGTVPKLSEKELDDLADVVEDPTFDVYVGKEDDTIRRVSIELRLNVPEEDQKKVGGIEGGSLRLDVQLGDVNGDQEVKAPARSRPISALTGQLGTTGGAQALGGSSSGQSDGSTQVPDDQAPGDSGGTSTQANPPSVEESKEAFQNYADCLDKTKPDDTESRARCAELLR